MKRLGIFLIALVLRLIVQTLPVTWSSPNLEITAIPGESPPLKVMFWQRQQAEGQPFDNWLTESRIIASNCEFGTSTNRQLRYKILFGTNDDNVRMLEC